MMRQFVSSFPYLASVVLFEAVIGCTPPDVPPAVGEADAVLERHDAKSVAAARPRLVAEARELARRAREEADRGETEHATLLARQAIQKFQTAKNFAEREQAERMLGALEKGTRGTRDDGREAGGRVGAREALSRAEDARDTATRGGARSAGLGDADEALRAARRAFDGEAWDRARTHANEARALFEGAGGRTGDREFSGGSFRSLSERGLVALALRRGELLGQLRDQSCAAPFREFEAILELGQRRFDAGDYERAYEFSLRAEERLRVCDSRSGPQTPVAQTKREADEEAARKKAAASLQKAQIELSRVQAQNREDPAAIQGQALLQNGDTWYARHAYAEANDLATRAYAVLSRVKAAPAAATPNVARDDADEALAEARTERSRTPDSPAKVRGSELLSQAERAFGARSYGDAKATAKRASEAFRLSSREGGCEIARAKITYARELDKKLGSVESDPRKSAARRAAQADVVAAEKKITERVCADAQSLAERARAGLATLAGEPPAKGRDGIAGRPWDAALLSIKDAERAREDARARGSAPLAVERGDVALKTANLAYTRDDFVDAERSAREARDLYAETADVLDPPMGSAVSRADEHLAKRAGALEVSDKAQPGYRAAYVAVFRALATREDAGRESPLDGDKLSQADAHLSTSREAWKRGRLAEAERAAAAASSILAKLASPSAEDLPADETTRARERASGAVAAAGELATACERARCDERDSKRAMEARTLVMAARRALATRRPKAARELARAAEEHWLLALEKPRKGHEPPKPDTDAKKALEGEADGALRDAEAARRTCETRECKADGTRAGRDAFVAAKVARVDGLYEASLKSAREAETLYRGAALAVFEIPTQVREVTRTGTTLVVAPPLAFKAGQKDLVPASETGVAALARTLSDNTRALRRVRLVVSADARGAAPQNKKLAETRADALRTALIGRGVPPELVVAEAGPPNQDPAAPARVDVVLELAEGVK